jgi:DNA-binding MarR family transcriptional regulator
MAVAVVVREELRHADCLEKTAAKAAASESCDRYHWASYVSINAGTAASAGTMNSPNPLFLREEELDRGLALLYFAGRQLNADADALRAEGAIDEIDHQALFMIGRHPGVTLAELCVMLAVGKQTLSRHLKRLAQAGLIDQESSADDRRKRHLRLTEKAALLLARVHLLQKRRLRLAFKSSGATAVEGFQRVLLDLVGEPRREQLRRRTAGVAMP